MERFGEIQDLLIRIERERGVRILYAVESGSRAWGFASPDSDFDIRFIYVWPEDRYLEVLTPEDTIELPIEDDLDAGGWELKKALSLLRKSNGPLVEWLHSPIVYRAKEGFLREWRDVLGEVFSPYGQVAHYRGLARQMWFGSLQGDTVRAKSYLYCLRATACAKWVEERGSVPPVCFGEVKVVLPDEVGGELDRLLELKAGSGEKDAGERFEKIDRFLEAEVERGKKVLDLRKPPERASILDVTFRREVRRSGVIMSKHDFTLERVRERDLLLFETVAGSRAFGTDLEGSDEDLKGVFCAPTSFLTGMDSIQQVQDERGDEVYFELGRMVNLLVSNNPNLMELLAMPEDCIRYRHAVMDLLKPEMFLSKRCEHSFGGYALGQIKKARGLNKKVVNPEPEERKELLDFCYVLEGQGSVRLGDWLAGLGVELGDCGLAAISHAPGMYGLYFEDGVEYRGVFSKRDKDVLVCSSVPKAAKAKAFLCVNEDAFKLHCKSHESYWRWVGNRNEERFLTNSQHDKGYDSKNMMHTLRLLDMAEEIAREGVIQVRRPNREFLLRVRAGEFAYDELLGMAEEKMESVREAYERCDLPNEVDREKVEEVLREMRWGF